MFPSVGFFGIGGSNKKKDEVSEGIVHDTKRDSVDPSKDILDEFEAQFSQGPVQAPEETHDAVPETVQSGSSAPVSHEDFKPPQPRPQSSPPFGQSAYQRGQSAPPQSQPRPDSAFGQSPQQSSSQPSSSPPSGRSAPQPRAAPAPSQPRPQSPAQPQGPAQKAPLPVEHAPTEQHNEDLPDFDFDFHPASPANAPSQPASPHQPSHQPAAHQPSAQTAPAQPPQQRTQPAQRPSRSSPSGPPHHDFDLPDFSSDAFSSESHMQPLPMRAEPERAQPSAPSPTTPEPVHAPAPQPKPKVWDDLTAAPGTKPWQEPAPQEPAPQEPVREERVREEPVREEPARQEPGDPQDEVIMRGGTLYIEKHALVKHVHDLNDLKGLSSSTTGQFERIDSLAKEEKAILDKMQTAIHALHDTLEQSDELLFSGDQS